MYTVLITVILAIIISYLLERRRAYWSDYFLSTIIGGMAGIFLGFIIALIVPHKTLTKTTTFEIENLQDNNSVSGSFFIGTGSIDGVMKYVFYHKVDGGFKMMQLDYKDTIIKYSNDLPRVEKLCNYSESNFGVSFLRTIYVIYVPEGTIKQSYILDAQ